MDYRVCLYILHVYGHRAISLTGFLQRTGAKPKTDHTEIVLSLQLFIEIALILHGAHAHTEAARNLNDGCVILMYFFQNDHLKSLSHYPSVVPVRGSCDRTTCLSAYDF